MTPKQVILNVIEYQAKWLKIVNRIYPKMKIYMVISGRKSNLFEKTYYVKVLQSSILGLIESTITVELTYSELNQINDQTTINNKKIFAFTNLYYD